MRENVYGHQKRLRFLISEIKKYQEMISKPIHAIRILDVGCGTGVMITRPLAEQGYQVTGLDIDEASIQQAMRLKAKSDLPNLTFFCGTLNEQSWEKEFDVIVCSEVLEHLEDPGCLISAMKEHLMDDGILLVTVPNGYGPFELDSLAGRLLDKIPGFRRLSLALEMRVKTFLLSLLGGRMDQEARVEENRHESLATLNESQPHCQRFTCRNVLSIFRRYRLVPTSSAKSSVWSGPLANLIMREFYGLIHLNCHLANYLPPILVSGWYFSFRKEA